MVFDLTRLETFKNVKVWLEELRENGNFEMSLMLVGNKSDMVEERKVSYEDAMSFAQENNLLYLETSAKTGSHVSEAFERLAMAIYDKVEEGLIDATQESSGVKIGTGISAIRLNTEKNLIDHEKSGRSGNNDGCIPC